MIGDKTGNVISDFMQNDEIPSYMPPMISFGANIFQVFCHYQLHLTVRSWGF